METATLKRPPAIRHLSADNDIATSNWWLVYFNDSEPLHIAIWPPSTLSDVLNQNKGAITALPIPPPPTCEPVNNASELLNAMRGAGFSLRLNGESLGVSQSRWIDDGLAALINTHKTDLIEILKKKGKQ